MLNARDEAVWWKGMKNAWKAYGRQTPHQETSLKSTALGNMGQMQTTVASVFCLTERSAFPLQHSNITMVSNSWLPYTTYTRP